MLLTTGMPWVAASSRAFRTTAGSLTSPERTTEVPVLVTLKPAPGTGRRPAFGGRRCRP